MPLSMETTALKAHPSASHVRQASTAISRIKPRLILQRLALKVMSASVVALLPPLQMALEAKSAPKVTTVPPVARPRSHALLATMVKLLACTIELLEAQQAAANALQMKLALLEVLKAQLLAPLSARQATTAAVATLKLNVRKATNALLALETPQLSATLATTSLTLCRTIVKSARKDISAQKTQQPHLPKLTLPTNALRVITAPSSR